MAMICRRLCRGLFSTSTAPLRLISKPFFSTERFRPSDANELSAADSDSDSDFTTPASSSSSSANSSSTRPIEDRPLDGGVDVGIYKAILVGQVGQIPVQKILRSGKVVTMTSVGTGGMNNRRVPLDNEEPREYADRCAVQWHRVVVYNPGLGNAMMKTIQPGSIVYVEGNLETKIFTDAISGLVRRVREIVIRRNGIIPASILHMYLIIVSLYISFFCRPVFVIMCYVFIHLFFI
ncbi:hypothetical protein Dimus_028048 [Dionaea muscipula]